MQLASLSRLKDSVARVDVMNRAALLYYEVNTDSTFHYAKLARAISMRIGYEKGKADAISNLGVFFDAQGNSQMALRYYYQGYQAYQDHKDSLGMVQAEMNIANVYAQWGKKQKAIEWYEKALHNGRQMKNDSSLSLVIYNYLLFYPERFKDSVQHYISIAHSISARYKDHRTLLAIVQLEANEMIADGLEEKGIACLDSAIHVALREELFYASMDMMMGLGDHLYNSQPERALHFYKKTFSTAREHGYLLYCATAARKLFDFYSYNDKEQAIKYAQELLALQDEKREQERLSAVDYLDYVIQENRADFFKQRAQHQRILLGVTIGAAILILVNLFMIRKNLSQARRYNAQVLSKNKHLHNTLAALEQSHEANARMLKIVAHDLRGPVGGINALTEMMLGETGRPDADMEMLELIQTASQDSLTLVDDLLQVQFTAESLIKEPIELSELLQYCINLLQPKAGAKRQQLLLHTTAVTLTANREKLWRVVSNLVMNAIKFSPEESTITVETSQISDNVRIAVKDTGIGIPEELRHGIFDWFSNTKRQGTSGEKSFGLGLMISKQIIEAHHGKIWFEPNQPCGTVFFIQLPLG